MARIARHRGLSFVGLAGPFFPTKKKKNKKKKNQQKKKTYQHGIQWTVAPLPRG
jgi:thiamine monophosphate synthase